MTSPLLAHPGAVPALGPDEGTAWHYGDPVREQRALESGQALVDLSTRGVVTVAGPDRLTWLDTLSTQWLRDLQPGVGMETLILSPHGHIEHALHLVDDGERTWIIVEPGTAQALVAHLEKMRFMLRVEIADVTADWAVLGAGTDPGLQTGGIVWRDPWPDGGPADTARYSDVDPHPAAGRIWTETLVPRSQVDDVARERPLAGTWACEALRVAAWRPRFGFETDHRTIAHELDWLRTAVHLHKGCYRGQETVARVHNLGRPPRRLTFLHLDGSEHDLPGAGAEVSLGERTVGRLTTVARHHELGPIALAVLKRSVDPAADILAGGQVSAAQEVIVAP